MTSKRQKQKKPKLQETLPGLSPEARALLDYDERVDYTCTNRWYEGAARAVRRALKEEKK